MPIPVAQFSIQYIIDSEDAVLANSVQTNFLEVETVRAQIAAGQSCPLVSIVLTKEEAEARIEELSAKILAAVGEELDRRVEAKLRELIPRIKAELEQGRA